MAEGTSIRVAFETARLRLAELHGESSETRHAAYELACKHSARTLDVARVSVWQLERQGRALVRTTLIDSRSQEQPGPAVLTAQEHPAFFKALADHRVLCIDDVQDNAHTRTLTNYLTTAGVSAMLSAPFYRDGNVAGVVFHEHEGVRKWTEKEAAFASAVADMLSILVQQAERAELRAALDEQRQLQAEHRKMQALIGLSRVVVHDLSNVLTIASARADELTEPNGSPAASKEIGEVLRYGSALLNQLKDFCEERRQGSEVEVVQAVRSLAPALRALLGPKVQLRIDFALAPTWVDVSQLEFEQLILNLCMNARDALGGEGEVAIHLLSTGDHLVVEVRDTGCGMSEEVQLRLFEPCFTTKSGHSGMGLCAVYGIVERASGLVEIESQVGHGTTFRLQLPLRHDGNDALDAPWSPD